MSVTTKVDDSERDPRMVITFDSQIYELDVG